MIDPMTAGNKDLDVFLAGNVMKYPLLAIGQMDPLVGYWDRGNYIELRDGKGNSYKWSPTSNLLHAMAVLNTISIYLVMSATIYINGSGASCTFNDFSRDEKVTYSGAAVGDDALCLAICAAAKNAFEKVYDV